MSVKARDPPPPSLSSTTEREKQERKNSDQFFLKMVGSSTSSKSPRSTSPFRPKKGSPSPFSSPAVKNVAGRPASPASERSEFSKPKENVTVTVRFRPLRYSSFDFLFCNFGLIFRVGLVLI